MFSWRFPRQRHVSRSGQSRRPQRRAFRPGLEALEDRCVPSTLAVTSTDDNVEEAGTLRFAVAHAASGDTILLTSAVQPGITLTQGDLVLSKNVSIAALGGQHITISGGGHSRIFEINAGVQVTLDNLELTQGNGTANNSADTSNLNGNGGAILSFGVLTLTNSILDNNSADGGGGAILNDTCSLTLIDTLVASNHAPGTKVNGFGGGVWNFLGTLNICHSAFDGNTALQGGGAITNQGVLTVSDTTFSNNTATGSTSEGGAILNFVTMTISDSQFFANTAGFGGAIFNNGGRALVTGSTFAANTGTLDGGAIYTFFGGTSSVGTSGFVNNAPDHIVGGFTDLGGNIFLP
jgi:predicted outer membrane repeat protein